jgi:hypothetical protein
VPVWCSFKGVWINRGGYGDVEGDGYTQDLNIWISR